jgi:vitamin B12 transporter
VSGSHERFNYAFNVSHLRSEDTPVTPERFVVPGRPAIGNFYDNKTGSTRLGYDFSPELSFNYVARYTNALLRRSDLEFPPPLFTAVAPLQQAIGTTEQFHNRGELTWRLLDGRIVNRFGAAYSNNINGNMQPGAPWTHTRGSREKFDARSDITVAPGHVFTVGAEREDEHFRKTGLAADNGNTGVFAELQSEFAKRFFLVLNARNDENDQFGSAFTWRAAGAALVPVTETKLKASYGTGFKAPSLSQLYEDFPPFFFANPNLRPERAKGYDAGFEQPLFNDRVRFGATYFQNDIEDLINCNTFCTTVINIDRARITGVETFVAATVTDRVKLRADYTHTNAINLITGAQLQRRPRDKFSIQGIFQPIDPLTITATAIHVSSRVDVDRAFVDPAPITPAYTIVNVAANYAINPYVTAFGRIDNLLNEKYEDPNGFLRPGFSVFAGLRLNN